METFLLFALRWVRIIKDKCEYCGGELWFWDTKKAYCRDCQKKQ